MNLIKELCLKHLYLDDSDLLNVHRLGGLTNRNYKVETTNENYVLRLPGEGTEELINRKDEHICTRLANEIDIDSELLYFENDSGIKISRYIEQAETMDTDSVRNNKNMRLIADIFKKLHNSGKTVPVIFDVFQKIEEYEDALNKHEDNLFWSDYEVIKEQVYNLKTEMDKLDIELTVCHNDPLCENFVKSTDKMYLVDWEYAGMNDPMWDLADFFIEANFGNEEEALFYNFYFEKEPNAQMLRRILINKVYLDFLWSLWGKQRTANGFDLLDYANERYIRAKMNLKILV